MNEREAYLTLHKASGIKVGDTVKVLRKAANYELGWDDVWMVSKNSQIGKGTLVTWDDDARGFRLNDGHDYHYPFFVLEKIASAPEDTIESALSKCNFGCQTENVKNLVAAIVKECRK